MGFIREFEKVYVNVAATCDSCKESIDIKKDNWDYDTLESIFKVNFYDDTNYTKSRANINFLFCKKCTDRLYEIFSEIRNSIEKEKEEIERNAEYVFPELY